MEGMDEDLAGRFDALTEEERARLGEVEPEFSRLVNGQDPASALDLLVREVGNGKVKVAALYMGELRTARIRKAAAAKGLRVGI